MEDRLRLGRQLWERARHVLPGGVSSNVKMDERPHPMFFTRGEGSRLYDADGNSYIDYTCGYGPVILGHAFPPVVEAIQQAASRGFIYGGQHEGEIVLAESLAATVPCVEMVRYASTGSEAVVTALRLARAYTGRTKVIRFAGHYHGWFDELLLSSRGSTDDTGRPELGSAGQTAASAAHVVVAPWNNLPALERLLERNGREVAAVLMEPIMCNTGVIAPAAGYLERVLDLCRTLGCVLIFDEVITGFRVHLGGAQALLGVTPDLAVFGKAVANGYPLSVVGGRREIMELIASGRVVHAGTFNGNPLATTAALATLQTLRRDHGAALRRLTDIGQRLMQGLRRVATAREVPILVQGPGPVFYLWFTDAPAITDYAASARVSREPYAHFAEAMLAEGIRLIPGGRWYVSLAHTEEDIDRTCEAVDRALERLRTNGSVRTKRISHTGGR